MREMGELSLKSEKEINVACARVESLAGGEGAFFILHGISFQ